jgi:hypothetical protein
MEQSVLQENVSRSTGDKDWVLGQFIEAKRRGRWLHYTTCYRTGFHSAARLAATQAGMKFAVAHNIPAFKPCLNIYN